MVIVHILNPQTETTAIRRYYFIHTAKSTLLCDGFLPQSDSDNTFINWLTGESAVIHIRR